MPDHVHMMISIPPKYAVSQVIGYVKGKSAIHLARVYGERRRNFIGSISGREDISSRPWGETKLDADTSRARKRKIRGLRQLRPLALIGHPQVAQ